MESTNTELLPPEGLFVNLQKMSRFNSDEVYTKALVKGPHFSNTLICISAGSGIAPHISSANACLLILSGSGTCKLGHQTIQLEPSVYVFIPAHMEHSLLADSDLSFLLCLIH